MIWTEKGEKIQDVADFQERLKGKAIMENKNKCSPPPHVCDLGFAGEVRGRGKRGEEQHSTSQFQIIEGKTLAAAAQHGREGGARTRVGTLAHVRKRNVLQGSLTDLRGSPGENDDGEQSGTEYRVSHPSSAGLPKSSFKDFFFFFLGSSLFFFGKQKKRLKTKVNQLLRRASTTSAVPEGKRVNGLEKVGLPKRSLPQALRSHPPNDAFRSNAPPPPTPNRTKTRRRA